MRATEPQQQTLAMSASTCACTFTATLCHHSPDEQADSHAILRIKADIDHPGKKLGPLPIRLLPKQSTDRLGMDSFIKRTIRD